MVEPSFSVPQFKLFPDLINFQWSQINVNVKFLTFKIFFSLFIVHIHNSKKLYNSWEHICSLCTEEKIMAFLENQTARSRAVIDGTKCGHG
jgi:hypothetical protein